MGPATGRRGCAAGKDRAQFEQADALATLDRANGNGKPAGDLPVGEAGEVLQGEGLLLLMWQPGQCMAHLCGFQGGTDIPGYVDTLVWTLGAPQGRGILDLARGPPTQIVNGAMMDDRQQPGARSGTLRLK
jgi:hypothetical protein